MADFEKFVLLFPLFSAATDFKSFKTDSWCLLSFSISSLTDLSSGCCAAKDTLLSNTSHRE